MKKLLCGLLALSMLLTMMSTALAAALPTVSFVSQSGAINGGCAYALTVKITQAPAADLPVAVTNDLTGETFTVTIPAGATQASVTVETAKVEKRTTVRFNLAASDAYKAGSRHTLTLHPLPRVGFYNKINFGRLGTTAKLQVLCYNTSTILKGNNTVQLRNSKGEVLSEAVWTPGRERISFSFDVTESMLGRHDLTVWLGDHCLTAEPGYLSLADTTKKVVQTLAPEVPVMAIGLDCGFSDGKYEGILKVLDEHNVKVTFFMTGYFMRTFPEVAKMVLDAGHEIANHSNTHKHMKELDAYTMYRQIMHPVEEAEELLGVTPRLFRPPFGEFNSYITSLCRGEGMEVVMWSIDYRDSFEDYTVERITKRATTAFEYAPGTIVLGHMDGKGMPGILEAGLDYYESLGLQVMPISALYYLNGNEYWPMPEGREALVYTDDYWPNWIRENYPEYAWVLDK